MKKFMDGEIQNLKTGYLLKLEMFKILMPSGEELYFQAAGRQDRDGWAHAIGAVIRSLSVSKQVYQPSVPFQTCRANTNVSEIFGAIQDPDAGVELGNHVRNGAVHKNCFKVPALTVKLYINDRRISEKVGGLLKPFYVKIQLPWNIPEQLQPW
ncbi:hypothetical protein KUTeg_021177 [Tegillarca granosa]|uniref:PH domain-containing protein n=1 Tax=Tegillarca granosa TaxID=220873 RepID=A0ABQ9EFH8_TEGGR|nr:hypothetical protein KUTeg_021177 [Tegillarca granosa]